MKRTQTIECFPCDVCGSDQVAYCQSCLEEESAAMAAELTELRKGRDDAIYWKTKAENLKHDRDKFRAWLADLNHKSPAAEFTSGPWREMADLVKLVIDLAQGYSSELAVATKNLAAVTKERDALKTNLDRCQSNAGDASCAAIALENHRLRTELAQLKTSTP